MEINSHRHKNQIFLPSNKDLCRQKFVIIQQYKRSHFLSCKHNFENNAAGITVSSRIKQHTASSGRNTIQVAKRNVFSQRSDHKEQGGNIPHLPAESKFNNSMPLLISLAITSPMNNSVAASGNCFFQTENSEQIKKKLHLFNKKRKNRKKCREILTLILNVHV